MSKLLFSSILGSVSNSLELSMN